MRFFSKASLFISLVGVGALCSGQVANAATATGTFNVTLTVTSTCSVSASDIAFASMATGTSSTIDASSTLTINCSNGASYSVALDNGLNASSGQRRMRRAATSDYINYNLYSDSGHNTAWATLASQTGSGSNQTVTVYGRVPASQSVPNAGSYSDLVTVTVSY